jgi:hypothetical protein
VFIEDKTLKEKLPLFAPVFASMLVKRAFDTNGIVTDSITILESSKKYRKSQDNIANFVSENVEVTGNVKDKIKQNELLQQFRLWFQQEQGTNRKCPKGQELYDYMDSKFKTHKITKGTKGWAGIKIIYETEDEMIDM